MSDADDDPPQEPNGNPVETGFPIGGGVQEETACEDAAAAALEEEPVPPEALLTPDERRRTVVRGLHLYFRRHNIQALTLALISLVTSAALWGFIYLFVFWFCLVAATLAVSFNPETLSQVTRPDLVSRYFPLYFALGGLVSMGVAWWVRRHARTPRLREARLYLLWIFTELLLAVPNATFAVWGNFSALARLRRNDAVAAARLLEHMDASDGAVPLSRVRVEIEDQAVMQRVLFALQLVGLVGIRERDHGWYLCLEKREALTLLVRSALGSGSPAR